MNPLRIEKPTSEAAHSGKSKPRLQVTPPQQAAQQSLFDTPAVAPVEASVEAVPRLVMRRTDDLKPHPSLFNHGLSPTNERLLALDKLGETIFEQPLLITQENLIVDGYARWRVAHQHKRGTVLCQVLQLTEQEALQRILQNHCRPEWLNNFSRIQLALELEPWFQEKARLNQSNGGKNKGLSKLTEDRRIDCRKQIATLAGVSTGNVTKVKQILDSAGSPRLIEALRPGEISIHRAWTLHKLSNSEQESALGYKKFKKQSGARIRKLLAKHVPKSDAEADSLHHLSLGFKGLKNAPRMAAHWELLYKLIAVVEREFPTRRSNSDEQKTDYQAISRQVSKPLGQSADSTSGPQELPEGA
jgi:hypothetical protein